MSDTEKFAWLLATTLACTLIVLVFGPFFGVALGVTVMCVLVAGDGE